jgi:SAM-dependent methyltransferase
LVASPAMTQLAETPEAAVTKFALDLPTPNTRIDLMYPPAVYRRPWNHAELLEIFPAEGIRALDVGAGHNPLRMRDQDELVTVDFEVEAGASVTSNVVSDWPFGEREFDLVNMSHVVEHFYPGDRDAVIRNVYSSLRPGGILFIRVPHQSSAVATGWEHFTLFGLNGVSGLCHGHNPLLPMMRSVSVGVSMNLDFYGQRSTARRIAERALSRYWRLTDVLLGKLILGIPEVQFMLMRMDPETEERLREGSSAYVS